MLQELGNALAFVVLAGSLPLIILFVSKFLRPDYPYAGKLMTYECGEIPKGGAFVQYNPRFYMVAIVFLVFDVEVALLFPVMTLIKDAVANGVALQPLALAFGFLFVLFVGLVYEWKTGDIDWVKEFVDKRRALVESGALNERLAHSKAKDKNA